MDKVSEGGGSFLFLVPFSEDRLASLERIALSGPEGSTALERRTPTRPMTIVIDPTTGRIRSILRGEAAEDAVVAVMPPGTVPREQLLAGNGVPVGRLPHEWPGCTGEDARRASLVPPYWLEGRALTLPGRIYEPHGPGLTGAARSRT